MFALAWPSAVSADALDNELVAAQFHADAIGSAYGCGLRPEEWATAALEKVWGDANTDVQAAHLASSDPREAKFYVQDAIDGSYMQGTASASGMCPKWLTTALLEALDRSIGWTGT